MKNIGNTPHMIEFIKSQGVTNLVHILAFETVWIILYACP